MLLNEVKAYESVVLFNLIPTEGGIYIQFGLKASS